MTEYLIEKRQESDRLPIDRRVADNHTALLHHFLSLPVSQRIGCIPTNAHQSNGYWKSHPFGGPACWFVQFSRAAVYLNAMISLHNAKNHIEQVDPFFC